MDAPPVASTNNEGRVLVFEPDDSLAATILTTVHDAAPEAFVDVARNLDQAHRLALKDRPDLFVLDMDAGAELGQDFLLDLRTSHPHARAIVLTGVHLESQREQANGIGAIHFLEKPFPHAEFAALVQALLHPAQAEAPEKFQGTLSDLHLSDIIQLKCMSGATSALEFTGPRGEKARIYFENGQVRHAVTPGREGVDAFNEIVSWKGGKISELPRAGKPPRSIDCDWQFLLMEAVRKVDEMSALAATPRPNGAPAARHRILVIDDSLMLLTFVQEVLADANYDVVVAATAEEGLRSARERTPDVVLLDYLLPDLRGDEVSRQLHADEGTAHVPVLYMSGFGADLANAQQQSPNVVAILNKPFSAEMLLAAVEQQVPRIEHDESEPRVEAAAMNRLEHANDDFTPRPGAEEHEPDSSPAIHEDDRGAETTEDPGALFGAPAKLLSLYRVLQFIANERLTGTLHCTWENPAVEVYASEGKIMCVSTHDPELYCPELPTTLVNVSPERLEDARANQRRTGAPLFSDLSRAGLIMPEAAVQLVQHYGQKLFAHLWCAADAYLAFEQAPLPDFAGEMPGEDDLDQWALATVRALQHHEIADEPGWDPAAIPAYTRDGFDRVQSLRLTTAEAQFASQFNGIRSIAQIARNLRLDLKFARVTLFRFVALEIVECWPPAAPAEEESSGVLRRLGRSMGLSTGRET